MRVAGVLLCALVTACLETQFGAGGNGGGPSDCEDTGCNDNNPCTQDICNVDGTCDHPAATVVTLQQPVGDCADAVCDGTELIQELNTSDTPSTNGNPCVEGTCEGSEPSLTPLPDGTLCGATLVCEDGVCPGCTKAKQCGMDTACLTFNCVNDLCSSDFLDGTIIAGADDGDCLALQCVEGSAEPVEAPLVTDNDDGNPCTTDACEDTEPTHTPVGVGTNCEAGTIGQCSAAGVCVECVDDLGCNGNTSCNTISNTCVECVTDAECNGQLEQCFEGTCVDCDSTGGCTPSNQCKLNTNVCVDCVTDLGCSNQAPLDQCVSDACVDCDFASGTDVGCAGGTPKCKNTNVCVQCLTNADCSLVTPACNVVTNTCQ